MKQTITWQRIVLGTASMCISMTSACALDDLSNNSDGEEESTTQADVTAGACTAVKMTAPASRSFGSPGDVITLSALATCPPGSAPEYQFWVKPAGNQNWTILGGAGAYGPGQSSWTLPGVGSAAITAVARAIGAPENYQVRAASVTVTIMAGNTSPVAVDDSIATTEGVANTVDVLNNDTDADSDGLTVTGHGPAVHGTVVFTGRIAKYTPAAGYVGSDSFTYTIGDGRGGSDEGTVNVEIADQAPIAADDSITTAAHTPGKVNVITNDSDPDNDALSVISFTQGASGTVTFAGKIATYTPTGNFVGSDSFTYTIDDGHAMTATATVQVMVTAGQPGCTISLSGPLTGTFGQNIHLDATAACGGGAAEVQWYHRNNSGYVVVQPYSLSVTLDFAADIVGNNTFYALVRTTGTTAAQGTSNMGAALLC